MEVRAEYIKRNLHTKKSAKDRISKRVVKLNNQFEKPVVCVWMQSVAHFMRDSTKINIAGQNSSYTSEAGIIT